MKKRRAAKLSKEEQAIENSLRVTGRVQASPERLKALREAAQTKEARVNIRMSQHDVDALKAAAEHEGIGYQTLMSSVIHKYVTGQLVERKILDELKDALSSKRRAS